LVLDVGSTSNRQMAMFASKGNGTYINNLTIGIRTLGGTDDNVIDYRATDLTPAVWINKPVYMTNGTAINSVADN